MYFLAAFTSWVCVLLATAAYCYAPQKGGWPLVFSGCCLRWWLFGRPDTVQAEPYRQLLAYIVQYVWVYAFGPLFPCFVEMDGLLCCVFRWHEMDGCYMLPRFQPWMWEVWLSWVPFFGLLAVCTLHTDSHKQDLSV